ncbi:MAG: hypothetical protein ACK52I_08555 [Pseudomonadota bacterium]
MKSSRVISNLGVSGPARVKSVALLRLPVFHVASSILLPRLTSASLSAGNTTPPDSVSHLRAKLLTIHCCLENFMSASAEGAFYHSRCGASRADTGFISGGASITADRQLHVSS